MKRTGLLTDQYELTMVDAALRSGAADRRCAFEVFARSLPGRRRYAVVAGLGRLLDAVPAFGFETEELDFLVGRGVIDDATRRAIASVRRCERMGRAVYVYFLIATFTTSEALSPESA